MNPVRLEKLTARDMDAVRALFLSVFTAPPWNDDWSDEEQLDHYLRDLTEVRTPLVLGLYEGDELAGVSIGHIRHWCRGTEYFIEEFCVSPHRQGKGLGGTFLSLIEEYLKERGLHQIFLMTERHVPAYDFYRKHGFEELKEHVSFFKEF